jgi:squalene-associated FAD-dependent desaturase
MKKIAIVGAGWAGMAAAVAATQAGHSAIVFEASRAVGGRARALKGTLPDGTEVLLDNGQHILIGAYTETLRLMRLVGVNPATTLLRLPLSLQYPDGTGLALPLSPFFPAPLDALAGMLRVRGWSWGDKCSLLGAATRWALQGYTCPAHTTVAQLCAHLSPRVMDMLIEPLCVSALNTPADRASAQVFLRVLKDSLMGGTGASNLLLPTVDLSALFPQAAAQWLQAHGGTVRLGARVESLVHQTPTSAKDDARPASGTWLVNGETFDSVVWATSASNAALALSQCAQAAPKNIASAMHQWANITQALQFEAITTVYAYAPHAKLRQPMLALPCNAANPSSTPAQFVFDRGQLGGPSGLLALVVSASTGDKDALQAQVLAQAHAQLGLQLQPVQTVVEKRATFACTPGLVRPPQTIAPGLFVCGDYVDGPYPATLEGAVRSGVAVGAALDK